MPVLGGLGLRLAYALVNAGSPPEGDAIYYSAQAELLAGGLGFTAPFVGGPSAEHPPLTALVMTPLAWVGDGAQGPMRAGMAVIGTVVVVAVALLGRRLGGDRAGLVAGALAAVYPCLWMNDGVVMSEALSALLCALVLLGAYRLLERPTAGLAVLTGGLVGVAVLTRAELALLLPLVVTPALVLRAGDRRWRDLALATAAAGLVVAPWALWNLTRFDRPVLLSTNDGRTLGGANCEDTWYGTGTGLWSQSVRCLPPGEGDPSVQSSRYRRLALDFAGERLARLPAVVAVRELRVWSLYAPDQMVDYNLGEDRPAAASWAGTVMYWLLLPPGALGLWSLRARGVPVAPLLGPFVLVALTAAAFYGLVRFRVPAEISLVVLAAVGIDRLLTPPSSMLSAWRLGAPSSRPPPSWRRGPGPASTPTSTTSWGPSAATARPG